jgi:hypothetical protein
MVYGVRNILPATFNWTFLSNIMMREVRRIPGSNSPTFPHVVRILWYFSSPLAVIAVTKFNQRLQRENEHVFWFPGGKD